jgi:hypothetical protein
MARRTGWQYRRGRHALAEEGKIKERSFPTVPGLIVDWSRAPQTIRNANLAPRGKRAKSEERGTPLRMTALG